MKLIIVFALLFIFGNSLDTFSYEKSGKDWPGLCSTGKFQSPINIIDKFNTEVDKYSNLYFAYNLDEAQAATLNKFEYSGNSLEVPLNIGELKHSHKDGTQEIFSTEKITVHYPSEHLITMNGQTPRYPLEIQIHHNFVKTSNPTKTNDILTVRKAIVSILFKDNSIIPGGDKFFARMGISELSKRTDGTYMTASSGEKIDINEKLRGSEPFGFNIEALIGLRNLLNSNHHIFRYYGSGTTPPCEENVLWFVFAQPRSVSPVQIEFLRAQLMQKRSETTGDENININALSFYGNNREAHIYDENLAGKIHSLKNGISFIDNLPIPKAN